MTTTIENLSTLSKTKSTLASKLAELFEKKKAIEESLNGLYLYYNNLKVLLADEYNKLNAYKTELEDLYRRKEIIIEKKKEINLASHQLKSQRTGIMYHVNSAKNELSYLHKQKSRLYEELESVKNEISYAYDSKNYYSLDGLKMKRESLVRDIEDIKHKIVNQKSIVESLQKELSSENPARTFLYESFRPLQEELDKICTRIHELKELKKNVSSNIASLKTKLAPISDEISKLKEQKVACQAQISELKKKQNLNSKK